MRSLSLESIPVNKNMKLLILLVALLVRTNPSLSKPTPNLHSIFKEIKQDLGGLQKEIDKLNQQEFKKHLSVSKSFFFFIMAIEIDFM